jgi:hypothetical protein
MAPEDHDAFVRWQGILIHHRGQTINLLIGLCTGLLAYGVNLVVSGHGPTQWWARASFRIAMVMLLLSIASGLSATFARVEDFGFTAETARKRGSQPAEASQLREKTTILGTVTKACFRVQQSTFLGGAIAFVASIWISYADRF